MDMDSGKTTKVRLEFEEIEVASLIVIVRGVSKV